MEKFLFMRVLTVVANWAEERVKDTDSWLWVLLLHKERYANVAKTLGQF